MSKIPRVVLGITIILFYASALCSDATFPPELRTTTYGIFNATVNSTGIFNATVNSTTGPPNARKPPASHTLRTVQVSLYAIVFAVGVTGNILVIATVASKRMRSVKNLLIGNLAVADLTTLVVCLPMIVVALFQGWPFGLDFCRYFFPLADVIVSASISTLCVITLDRFRAIVYPFARKMSLRLTVIVIIMIWLVSYALVALPLNRIMVVERSGITGALTCHPKWPDQYYIRTYRLAILIVLYVIPVSLIFFCFVCIWLKIKSNVKFMQKSVRDCRSVANLRKRVRVVKLMFVIFITFTICLLPIHLLLAIIAFYPQSRRWPFLSPLYHVSILVLVTNSCMNPIILYVMSTQFKIGFKENCLCYWLYRQVKKRSDDDANEENPTACLTALQLFNDSSHAKDNDLNKNGYGHELIPLNVCNHVESREASDDPPRLIIH